MKHLKAEKPGNWYRELKKLCTYDQMKTEKIVVNSRSHMTDQEQAEANADEFAKVRNYGLNPLK